MSFPKTLYAISVLAGTTIGVGLFGLPYLALKTGFSVIFFYIFFLTVLSIVVHYLFGEICLKTEDFKRFPTFVSIYLGKKAKKISYFSTIIGLLGSLLAYMIVGGEFLKDIFYPYFDFGNNNFFYTFLYFLVGAIIIFLGVKAVAFIEFWGLIAFFIILLFIFVKGYNLINVGNLFLGDKNWFDLGLEKLFLPYGVVLFSLWGAALIPEAEEILGKDKEKLKWIIPVSIIIPSLVYLFFIYLILGMMGENTSESALVGLRTILGNKGALIALFFGILTTFTSFIALGLTLKKVLWYDLGISKNLSFVITVFFPFLLYILGFNNFIKVISFIGSVALAIDGILISLMYRKIKPEKRMLSYFLILFFVLGIIYSINYFVI